MSRSDTLNPPRDVRFVHVGVGHPSTFLCAACARSRPVPGRRLRRVAGLRTWVCAHCARKEHP